MKSWLRHKHGFAEGADNPDVLTSSVSLYTQRAQLH